LDLKGGSADLFKIEGEMFMEIGFKYLWKERPRSIV